MSAGENKILTAIQYQPVHEKISQIDACLDMIPTIIKSFPNNSVRLIASIDEQLTTYGNLDTDLTNLVFGSSPASQQSSIIDSIATLCAPDSQSCQTVSSTNQVFYEFHKHIMVYIAKGNEFQTICYQIKELVTQVDHSEDIEFARNKMESNMQKVMMSLNETLIKYKDSSYQKSHMHLIVQPVENGNYVKPKNSEKITNGYQSHYNFYTGLIVVKTAGQ